MERGLVNRIDVIYVNRETSGNWLRSISVTRQHDWEPLPHTGTHQSLRRPRNRRRLQAGPVAINMDHADPAVAQAELVEADAAPPVVLQPLLRAGRAPTLPCRRVPGRRAWRAVRPLGSAGGEKEQPQYEATPEVTLPDRPLHGPAPPAWKRHRGYALRSLLALGALAGAPRKPRRRSIP